MTGVVQCNDMVLVHASSEEISISDRKASGYVLKPAMSEAEK